MSWGLISEMGHVGIQTTDMDASLWDATQLLGLRVTEQAGDTAYLAAGDVHHELLYRDSNVNGIDSLGLIAKNGDALRTIRQRVEKENMEVLPRIPLTDGVGAGFAFVGLDDHDFEIYIGRRDDRAEQNGVDQVRCGHVNYH